MKRKESLNLVRRRLVLKRRDAYEFWTKGKMYLNESEMLHTSED